MLDMVENNWFDADHCKMKAESDIIFQLRKIELKFACRVAVL